MEHGQSRLPQSLAFPDDRPAASRLADVPANPESPRMTPSGVARLWQVGGWLLVAAIICLSLMPAPPDLGVDQGDKIGHLAAYAFTMLWFAQHYTALRQRLWLALGLVTLGVAIEYAQRATGYRTFEVADMAADAFGVALGWLAAPPRLPNLLSWAEKRLTRIF